MKVLNDNVKYTGTVICHHCKCELEYGDEDVISNDITLAFAEPIPRLHVICPKCSRYISIQP